MLSTKRTGFTLLEILLVVGAIGILAAIVIVSINPTKQLAQTKNAARRADANTVLNAIYQYAIDNYGTIPTTVSTTNKEICKTGVATATCNFLSLVDLRILTGTTSDAYVISMPEDPSNTATSGTGYWVQKTVGGRVTVSAPLAELGVTISITK